MIKKLSTLLLIITLTVCCVPRKKMAYFADIQDNSTFPMKDYQTVLQPDDLLGIAINSKSDNLTSDFNKSFSFQKKIDTRVDGTALQTYLIDKEGFIVYPIIGKIKLGGLTREQAVEKLTQHIKPYIADVSVNLRVLNFKIIVQGEVNKPGVYTIDSERVTLLQALAMAGDLTIFGKRTNILVMREEQGERRFKVVDITKPDFLNSEYYFLQQNDVVYVEPNKTRINSSAVGANTSAIISAISVTIAIISLIIR